MKPDVYKFEVLEFMKELSCGKEYFLNKKRSSKCPFNFQIYPSTLKLLSVYIEFKLKSERNFLQFSLMYRWSTTTMSPNSISIYK